MPEARFDRYDLCAGAIILLATVLRFAMISLGWPASYNDEGTVGLMALHIAYHGTHPLLYYGQDYMGSLEAYPGALAFHLFGPSTLTLRLGLLLLFAGFLFWMYRLTILLYSKSLALLTLLVLALGSPEVIFRELMVAGGPPDYFFFTSLLMLITVWLILTARPSFSQKQEQASAPRGQRLPWLRLLVYAAWGVVAGLAIWSHLLCIPFVVGAAILLAIFCRHELHLPALALLIVCLLIGMSPQIIYKITVPVSPDENSLFSGSFGGGYREPSYPPVQGLHRSQATIAPKAIAPVPGQQVAGTILVSIPVATNGTAICPIASTDAWPLASQTSTYTLVCTGVHGAWGLGFLVLWGVAAAAAVTGIRRYRKAAASERELSAKDRHEMLREAGRLTLLVCAGLSVLAFLLYPQAAGVTPWNSARYLVGLLLALPAVLCPLWEMRQAFLSAPRWPTRCKTGSKYVLLACILLTCFFGTINIFATQFTQSRVIDRQQQDLIAFLLHQGDTRVYTGYDDCNRLAFLSNEKIVCAVLDNGFQPGLDRYFPYRAMVAEAAHPTYAFVENAPQTVLFEQKAAQRHVTYQKFLVAGYVVYEPAQRLT